MPKKLIRLDGMTPIIIDAETTAIFLLAPSVEIADKIVELWNNEEKD